MDLLSGVSAVQVAVALALTQLKFRTHLPTYRRCLQGDICYVFSPTLFLLRKMNSVSLPAPHQSFPATNLLYKKHLVNVVYGPLHSRRSKEV